MKSKSAFWAVYKNLEKEVIELSYAIHFTDGENRADGTVKYSQLETYSNKIADLLISCAVQIEALFKDLTGKESIEEDTIGTAIKELNDRWDVEHKCVKIVSRNIYFNDVLGDFFAPMEYKEGDDNDYYTSYCSVKHNRGNVLYKANINVLIRAMAALYILNLYYNDHSMDLEELDAFDPSQGSDIFIAHYGDVNEETELEKCIFLVEEDQNYTDELENWAAHVPNDLHNALIYEKSTPPPKRYKITLNKLPRENNP